MCGLTGFWQPGGFAALEAKAVAAAMAQQLVHRGPDDAGVWLDADAGLALAHRRLAILDLSPAGHQPMVSVSGRYVLVFNGEIYNYLELRRELDDSPPNSPLPGEGGAKQWHGHSDTRILLAGVEAWGFEATLQKSVGMFAIALWDRAARVLTLARDRMGEKPLYYGWQGDTFLFGSELKALKAHPAFQGEIDRDSVTLMLRHNCIPAPYSIYKGIRKLPPGMYLHVEMGKREGEPVHYWSLCDVAERGQAQQFTGSEAEAVTSLEAQLLEAIGLQMMADVPLGAFLSGGIDSSTIVALMQEKSSRPVKTFTIGFHEEGYNEAQHARVVAQHLGTEHTELYVTSNEAINVIPRLPMLYDEPFADSSQIPTFLVAQLAKHHVTVSLSGDAGDELFGGYGRYFLARSIWRKVGRIPYAWRKGLAGCIGLLSPEAWNVIGRPLVNFLPERLLSRPVGDRAHRLAEIIATETPENLYHGLLSHWKSPADVVIGGTEPQTILTDRSAWPKLVNFEQRMMYLDTMSYLPDDILVKVDRAAMGLSLETRVPFLDHRVVEFASRLPLSMKIRHGQGKWILKQVLNKYVPQKLVERSKMGFGVPIDSWLRGPLREWSEALLDESRLQREGYFNPAPIRQKWTEHLSRQYNWHYYLWDILMFQAWLEDRHFS
jgi:asparagine synthase (glutamine-hydrolysing)